MLLAIESTEVAEQDQDRRAAQELAGGEDFTVNRLQIEVEVDPHRTMMQSAVRQSVIRVTVGRRS